MKKGDKVFLKPNAFEILNTLDTGKWHRAWTSRTHRNVKKGRHYFITRIRDYETSWGVVRLFNLGTKSGGATDASFWPAECLSLFDFKTKGRITIKAL